MSLWHDTRYAVRLLVRDRWFTLAAVVALALGIGANATVFTLVNAILLRGLPFDEPERIVVVWSENVRGQRVGGASYDDFEDWRRAKSFSHMVATLNSSINLSDDAHIPERYAGSYVSWNFFRLLGTKPILGRDFEEADDRPGTDQVAILSYAVWQKRYGGDPGVIGQTLRVNSRVVNIIGVMPAGMEFPDNTFLWIPRVLLPPESFTGRGGRGFEVIAQLAPNVSIEQARAELQGIGEGLSRQYPATNKEIRPNLEDYAEDAQAGPIRLVMLAMMGAVGFVLLIACANVANLLLARSIGRSREIAIRASIGASRGRIVRQLLVESVLLASLGGLAGLGLAIVGVRWFDWATTDVGKPSWMVFSFDPVVFGFVALVCLATGVLFGLAPALHVSKTDVNEVLKEGGRSGGGSIRARRWSSALIIGEVVLTIVLLSGAGYMMRSFLALYRLDVGINPSNLVTMDIYLPLTKYPQPGPRAELYDRFEQQLRQIGEIQSSVVSTSVPMSGGLGSRLALDGKVPAEGESAPSVVVIAVGDDYFDTMGVPLRRGRLLRSDDGRPGHEAVLVNERFVALHSANQDPLGRQVKLVSLAATGWSTIVGVVPNVHSRVGQGGTQAYQAIVYLPLRASPERQTVLTIRTTANVGAVTERARQALRVVEPDIPLYNVMTMEQRFERRRWEYVVFGSMFVVFAAIALVLSAVGLYAVTSYSVTERTQEIGVRLALGAQRQQILRLVLKRALMQMAIGLPVGIAGAVGVGFLLQSLLIGTGPSDVATLAVIVLLLMTVAIVACLRPALKAARFDPMIALRGE